MPTSWGGGESVLKEWEKFLKDNPSFGAILVILFVVALCVAPLHPQICAYGEHYPCKDVIHQNLLEAFFYYINYYSGAIIAFFTFTLWVSTRQQATLTRDIAKLSRDEFNATHRPKITTRFFRPNTTDPGVNFGENISVFFQIVNEGEADAKITAVGTRVFEWTGPWTRGAREIQFHVVRSEAILKSGQEERVFTAQDFPRAEILRSTPSGETSWWCIGYIDYLDRNDVRRRTGFCRKWNFETKAWDREKNGDWEYSY